MSIEIKNAHKRILREAETLRKLALLQAEMSLESFKALVKKVK